MKAEFAGKIGSVSIRIRLILAEHTVRSAAIFLLALCSTQVWATTVVPPNLDELVKEAEVIFEGNVTAIKSHWAGENETRRIETDFTFQVTETLKGDIPSTYVLHVLGGTVGDVSLDVDGSPHFAKGDRALLFVTHNGTQFVPLVGIMHGHYQFKHDHVSNKEIVVRHDGATLRSVDGIGKDKATAERPGPTAAAPMTPEAFKDSIKAKTKEQER